MPKVKWECVMSNHLSEAKKMLVLSSLEGGVSIRSVERISCFTVGKRKGEMAHSILCDLQARISTRFQLSTDSFAPYKDAVDRIWGEDIDYGQIHKEYREFNGEKRYSPGQIVSTQILPISGQPIRKRISTSHIERQNLTMRMQMRRFTRLTNAFSNMLDNLNPALALHFVYYNFMRVHQTLRVIPAMEAQITNRLWTWAEVLDATQRSQAA